MEIKQTPNNSRRNQGQTLAEFSLTLPILLLLLFGIIEFGRLFQSWVTIQNAVRAASRYVVTGRYDEERYPSLDAVIPCRQGAVNLAGGTYLAPLYTPPGFDEAAFKADVVASGQIYNDRYQYSGGVLSRKVPIFVDNGVVDNEHFYRTWYGVPDCVPSSESEQDRKDMLRLPSVYNAARIGAAGLALDENPTNVRAGETESQALQRYLFSGFSNPGPSVDTPAWFNVLICSNRAPRYGQFGDASSTADPEGSSMFDFVEDANDQDIDYAEERLGGFPGGACVNKEKLQNIPGATAYLDFYGTPKMDAGEAGERVYVVITYNHPLITPLGLARYVQMQGSRAAINESFKVTNAERALGPSQPAPPELPEETAAVPPTPVTPPPTLTPSLTPTPITPTVPPTLAVFACENISVSPIGFIENRVQLTITNANREDTRLTGAKVIWDNVKLATRSATAGVQQLSMNGNTMWFGDKKISPVDTRSSAKYPNPDTGNGVSYIEAFPENSAVIGQDTVAQNGNDADNTNEFQVFFSSIENLRDVFEGWEFAGSELYFDNPFSPQDCVIKLIVPNAPPPPTATPVGFVPSPTATPNCASNLLKVTFEGFASSGDLVLKITNNRTVEAPFRGFSLVWPAYKVPNLYLRRVVVGGTDADDSTGTTVWNSIQGGGYRPPNVVFNVPPASVTRHDDITAGTWNDNNDPYDVAYSFPRQSTTLIHIDFTGISRLRLDEAGISASDFNGTRFFIECGRGNRNPNGTCSTNPCNGGPWGGGGGGGGGGLGDIGLDNQPTPTVRVMVTTAVPAPTLTPSRTPIPQPPTNTFTPGPTKTFTTTPLPNPPTNTPSRTPSRTPVDDNPND
jgi:hypothetical protein